mmetsp:Transcript_57018/g.128193  ORF Transcript_57018/g.128193 Transcript_57018/m.128193 type:complete len:501 (+) Transcript_57018:67-1569(+)
MGAVPSTVLLSVLWTLLGQRAVVAKSAKSRAWSTPHDEGLKTVKSLIADVVARQAPEQLDHSKAVLDRFISLSLGKEHRLYAAICNYYGEEPDAQFIEPLALPRLPSSQRDSRSKSLAKSSSSTAIQEPPSVYNLTLDDWHRLANAANENVEVEDLREYGHELYDLVYGLGNAPAGGVWEQELWWRHQASPRRVFVESYMGLALGKITPDQSPAPELGRAPLRDSVEELLVQKRQKGVVRARTGPRPWQRLSFDTPIWEREEPCQAPMWRTRYPNCKRPQPNCRKVVVDNFITRHEALQLIDMMEKHYNIADRIGYRTVMSLDERRRETMGEEVYNLTGRIFERMHEEAAYALQAPDIWHHTSVMIRVDTEIIADERNYDTGFDSKGAHSDKANHGASDYIAALYLNEEGVDLDGGELIFHDNSTDLRIPMRTGRLVLYTGGMESVHSSNDFTGKPRHLLSFSFTCNEEHAVKALGRYASALKPVSWASVDRMRRLSLAS